jgi:hypothetical protein
MDKERAALTAATLAADEAIDRLSAPMAGIVVSAIEKYAVKQADGSSRITPLARRRIMKVVDAEIARVYGGRRGAPSPMYDAIAKATTATFGGAVFRQSKAVRRALAHEPELREALIERTD